MGVKCVHLENHFLKDGWDLTLLCILASLLYVSSQTAVRQASAIYYLHLPDGVLRMLLDTATKMSWDVAAAKG